MTSVVQFVPNITAAFRFQPVIAAVQYTAIITWNVYGQRYYLNLFDSSGNRVLTRPVVASGLRTGAVLTWSPGGSGGVATVNADAAHNVPVGRLARVRISQTDAAYDGIWLALATGPNTMVFGLANPNEPQPVGGQLSFNVNLVAALGAGWMIYRSDTQQFEYESAAAA